MLPSVQRMPAWKSGNITSSLPRSPTDEQHCRLPGRVESPCPTSSEENLAFVWLPFSQATMWFGKPRPYKPLLGDNEDQSDTDESTTTNLRRLKRDVWAWKLAPAFHSLVTTVLLIIVAIGVYRETKLFHSRCVRELHTPCTFLMDFK